MLNLAKSAFGTRKKHYKCVICGKNNKEQEENPRAFFAVTSDRIRQWMPYLQVVDVKAYNYVCSEHFDDQDMVLKKDKLKLKERAIPKEVKQLKTAERGQKKKEKLKDENFETASDDKSGEDDLKKDPDFVPDLIEIRRIENLELASHRTAHEMSIILKDPKHYLGLYPKSLYVLDMIERSYKVNKRNTCIILMKIRHDLKLKFLADHFGLHITTVSTIFTNTLPKLAAIFRIFVFLPNVDQIQMSLPVSFRYRFHHVQSVVDSVGIQIEKPKNDVIAQRATFNTYYHGNVIKYSVACIPNGMIHHISFGFLGNTSDQKMIERDQDYTNQLHSGKAVLADRGYRHLADFFRNLRRGIKLIMPPVVGKNNMTDVEVEDTRQISSNRIIIERVIGRMREFQLISHQVDCHLKFNLDDIMMVIAGLCNINTKFYA